MKTVQLLEKDDQISGEDWCRPLNLCTMNGGYSDDYSFKSMYTGTPENNVKWVKVKHVLDKMWFGYTVSELRKKLPSINYEYLRGDLPHGHALSMTGYNKANKRLPASSECDWD